MRSWRQVTVREAGDVATDGRRLRAAGRQLLEREEQARREARGSFPKAWKKLDKPKRRSWMRPARSIHEQADSRGGRRRLARGGRALQQCAIEVALIHRPRYDDWSIPKGKLAAGESELEGALREVFEETGYRVRPGRGLGEVHYLKSSERAPREKVVRYWAMRAVAERSRPTARSTSCVAALAEAPTRFDAIERPRGAGPLLRWPAFTRTVLLVRHASAGTAPIGTAMTA